MVDPTPEASSGRTAAITASTMFSGDFHVTNQYLISGGNFYFSSDPPLTPPPRARPTRAQFPRTDLALRKGPAMTLISTMLSHKTDSTICILDLAIKCVPSQHSPRIASRTPFLLALIVLMLPLLNVKQRPKHCVATPPAARDGAPTLSQAAISQAPGKARTTKRKTMRETAVPDPALPPKALILD